MRADEINHLVSQTRGEFQNPEFVGGCFGRDNIARIATERQAISVQNRRKSNYSSFDFAKHLQPADESGVPLQGLFFLRAVEWLPEDEASPSDDSSGDREVVTDSSDPESFRSEGRDDEGGGDEETAPDKRAYTGRFILVTDLGLVVKENADGSRDVFIASIKAGDPLGGVTVQVLAKNGVPLFTGQTAADGRLPPLARPAGARESTRRLRRPAGQRRRLHAVRAARPEARLLPLRYRRRGEPLGRGPRCLCFHRARHLPARR